MGVTTWRRLIETKMVEVGDSWDAVRHHTGGLDVEFDNGFGVAEGQPFTLWTDRWVYFPVVYDGAEWVGCVERHPSDTPTEHFGGG